jgi:protein-tyrosine phosphatase
VSPNSLLAGEYPRTLDERTSKQKIAALIGAGIRSFIDLTEESEGLEPYEHLLACHSAKGVTYQRFPIADVSVPASRKDTAAILDAIDGPIRNRRIVYVHCLGGVGRTGVIVGCWLARHGYHGEAALTRLSELWKQCPKSARRPSPETQVQEQYIAAWTET